MQDHNKLINTELYQFNNGLTQNGLILFDDSNAVKYHIFRSSRQQTVALPKSNYKNNKFYVKAKSMVAAATTSVKTRNSCYI
jgi:hypothetical protein